MIHFFNSKQMNFEHSSGEQGSVLKTEKMISNQIWAIAQQHAADFQSQLEIARSSVSQGVASPRILRSGLQASQAGVLRIRGPLTRYRTPESDWLGWPTYEEIVARLGELDDDKSVQRIYLHIDSVGGEYAGADDAASVIRSLKTPTTAIVDGVCASGAYWLASQTDKIVASPTSLVGGVGVHVPIEDRSRHLAADGIFVNEIASSPAKLAGSPYHMMTTDEREMLQATVDDAAGLFECAVVKKRKSKIKLDALEGTVVMAERALALGLIDEIAYARDILPGGSSRSPGRKQPMQSVDKPAIESETQSRNSPKPSHPYFAQVWELEQSGFSRAEAMAKVNRDHPELRKQLLATANK